MHIFPTRRSSDLNLKKLLASESMQQDDVPSLYVYQLETDSRTQTGVFACASVQDYDNDVILKHELTRPDKEDDRTRHILTQKAHAEPVKIGRASCRERG